MFGDWAPVLAKSQHVPHFGQRLGSGLVGIIVFQCSITCLSCTFHSINLRVKTQCFLRSWELNRWKPSRCLNTVSKTFKFPKTLLYVILAQVRDIYPIKTLIISTHPFPCKNLHWVGLVTVDNALQRITLLSHLRLEAAKLFQHDFLDPWRPGTNGWFGPQ